MPQDKEKHFTVTEVEFDVNDAVISCSIEAVMSKRSFLIEWQVLKDATQWRQGWK